MAKKLFSFVVFSFIILSLNIYGEDFIIKVFEPKGEQILVTRELLTIIGEKYDKKIKEIKIKINDQEYSEPLKSEVFHIVIKLIPGENVLTLYTLDILQKKIHYFTINIYFKKERDFSEKSKKYNKYIFHNEKTKEFCEKCHIVDANKGKKDICYLQCHKKIIEVPNEGKTHGPVGEGACLACHDPDGVDAGYSPLIAGGKLCYTCHENVVNTGKFPHAAAKMMDCQGCHDPHGSSYPFFIKEPERKVCLRCHLNMTDRSVTIYDSSGTKLVRTEVYTVKNQHPPVKEGYCLKCHDPHVSDFGRAHLRKKTSALCKNRECHAAIIEKFDNHFHVYDVNPAQGAPVKLPKDLKKDEYNNVVCYSCHDPHGSNNKGFLRKPVDKICSWCHTNMPKRPELRDKNKAWE